MRSVACKLRCRNCDATVERTLNLPEGVSPPTEFACAECTRGQTGFDAMAADEVAKFTRRDGRLEDSASRAAKRMRAAQWDREHADKARLRSLFRADRGFVYPPIWTARVGLRFANGSCHSGTRRSRPLAGTVRFVNGSSIGAASACAGQDLPCRAS